MLVSGRKIQRVLLFLGDLVSGEDAAVEREISLDDRVSRRRCTRIQCYTQNVWFDRRWQRNVLHTVKHEAKTTQGTYRSGLVGATICIETQLINLNSLLTSRKRGLEEDDPLVRWCTRRLCRFREGLGWNLYRCGRHGMLGGVAVDIVVESSHEKEGPAQTCNDVEDILVVMSHC